MILLSQVMRTAKKEHRCDWCPERVKAGEKYLVITATDRGSIACTKLHTECGHASAREQDSAFEDELCDGTHQRGLTCEETEEKAAHDAEHGANVFQ